MRKYIFGGILAALLMAGPAVLAATDITEVACDEYYQFGSVILDSLRPDALSYQPGETMIVRGAVENKGPTPVVNGGVLAQVVYNNYIIDEFWAARDLNIAAQGRVGVSFAWPVASSAAAGDYDLRLFFTTSDVFNYSGLSFLETFQGSTAGFKVEGAGAFAPLLSRASITVNGKPYSFSDLAPTFEPGQNINFICKSGTKGPGGQAAFAVYYWDALKESNLVKEALLEVAPGGGMSYLVKDLKPGAYLLKVATQQDQTATVMNLRFAVTGEAARFNALGLNVFPGNENEIFACVHGSASRDANFGGLLTFKIKDASGRVLQNSQRELDIVPGVKGYVWPVTLKTKTRAAIISAEMKNQAGDVLDSLEVKYDCAWGAAVPNAIGLIDKRASAVQLIGENWCGEDINLTNIDAQVFGQSSGQSVINEGGLTSAMLAGVNLPAGFYKGLFAAGGLSTVEEFEIVAGLKTAPLPPEAPSSNRDLYLGLIIAFVILVLILLILAFWRRGRSRFGVWLIVLILSGLAFGGNAEAGRLIPARRNCIADQKPIAPNKLTKISFNGEMPFLASDLKIEPAASATVKDGSVLVTFPTKGYYALISNGGFCGVTVDDGISYKVTSSNNGNYCVDFTKSPVWIVGGGPAYHGNLCWGVQATPEVTQYNSAISDGDTVSTSDTVTVKARVRQTDWVEEGTYYDTPPITIDGPIKLYSLQIQVRADGTKDQIFAGVGCGASGARVDNGQCDGTNCKVSAPSGPGVLLAASEVSCQVKIAAETNGVRAFEFTTDSIKSQKAVSYNVIYSNTGTTPPQDPPTSPDEPAVTATNPNFYLECAKPDKTCTATVQPGGQASFTVIPRGGTNKAIIKVNTAAQGLTVNQLPQAVNMNAPVNFTVTTAALITDGRYVVKLHGQNNTLTDAQDATIIVKTITNPTARVRIRLNN